MIEKKFVSLKGFLSTSRDKKVALNFAFGLFNEDTA
jgi:hypothetical protein